MPFNLVKNEIYDRQAFDIIGRILKIDSNAIDIGCHQGSYLNEILKHAPNGNHIAFEPIPHLAATLRKKFPSVQIYPYALSSNNGETTFFYIPDFPALSGLNTRDFLAQNSPRQEINVSVKKLDDLVPEAIRIDLIKIDVEGAEGHVISGALETIKRNKPHIILEHDGSSSMAFGFSSGDIYNILVEKCGLRLSLLKNWLYGRSSLSKQEFIGCKEWYFIAYP